MGDKMYLGSNCTNKIPDLSPSILKMEGITGTGPSSSAGAGASAGTGSAPTSGPISTYGDIVIPEPRALDLTVDATYKQIPKDVPPTLDKRIPPTSTLWRDLKAKYTVAGLDADDYEEGSIIMPAPIRNVGDTGYTFNYLSKDPSQQAQEARGTLNMLLEQVEDAHKEASRKEKLGPATDFHATHQYLACRDDYQKRFARYAHS